MESFDEEHSDNSQEFKRSLHELADSQLFDTLAAKLFPDTSVEELRQQLSACDNARQFQSTFMYRCCQWVIENTMSQFTFSGTEHLDGTPSLFISNHRDIVLDAMMLQYILVGKGLDTSHIVIGANLFEMPLMELMAKTNKMYSIGRGGTPREYYRSLITMSEHLRHLVTRQGESVWIAQRNGRTKDGIDHTDPALIKMIAGGGNTPDPASALGGMHITPISVSYEWEPCGLLKARELCLRAKGPYTKSPGEDSDSILRGILDFKGHVHFTICQPLQPEVIEACRGDYNIIADIIDQRISEGYHLWPNNFIAQEMLADEPLTQHPQETKAFKQYIDDACLQYPLDDTFRQFLLGIYANPLKRLNHSALEVQRFYK